MFDITLIENIYLFLTDFEKQNFISKDIRLRVISKTRNKTYFVSYPNLQALYEANKSILDNVRPNRYCVVGDYPFIENIKYINNNTNYLSEYCLYNVTSGNPFTRDKTKFDNNRNDFYEFDKVKYIEYVKKQTIEHNDRNIELADLRLSTYVDACYIDPGYVAKEPVTYQNSIRRDLE